MLRVVAEHADIWNVAGVDIADAASRSALLDRYCAEAGRDPATIVRSTNVAVSYDDPATTRRAVAAAVAAGFTHIVLSLGAPYPPDVVRWTVEEIVSPERTED
jgi:alkanesulfonate monooxygenase SsuD/methylene tetrahydromethanopterin reductase-like flavin-dependent oxidoreductase (luciferase family)